MAEAWRLLAIFAHPDDEALGAGGLLATYAAQGVETYLITATRGERGWGGPPEANPGLTALGQIREAELRAASQVLGLRQVILLDYIDGELDQADAAEIVPVLAGHIRRLRPHVVLTFGPEGSYGHPDHIAISQFTAAAIVHAAGPHGPDDPYQVAKFYYLVDSERLQALLHELGVVINMQVDGVLRELVGWREWAITTRIDAADQWRTVWQAVMCHQTQTLDLAPLLAELPESMHRRLWGDQALYRVFSLVNSGRAREHDLFAGLRPASG